MLEPIRVVVVDDQPLFSAGISMLIEAQPDMDCVATATSGLEAITVVERLHPDIVLMDVRMPGMNGLDATRAILAWGAADDTPRVIVLTTLKRDEVVAKALEVGASGFLTKDATPDEVLTSIRTVHAGDAVPDLLGILELVRRGPGATPQQASIDALSPREREVFLLVARGLTNSEIATASYVSEATVKTHLAAILRKLQLRSRVQVVVFAHKHDLVG